MATEMSTVVCYRDRSTSKNLGYELVDPTHGTDAIKAARLQYMQRYLNQNPRTIPPICQLHFHVFGTGGQILEKRS